MADRYWVGGTGTWGTTTTNWSASSGGASGASAPTSADDVYFDGNSNVGTGNFTVTISGAVNCASITISGLDGVLTLSGSGTQSMNIYGNVSYQASNITQSGSFNVNLRGTGTHTLDFGGRTISGGVNIFAGTYTLTSAFVGGGSTRFDVVGGAFDTGNYNMTVNYFEMTGTGTKSATLGSSTITLAATSPRIDINPTGTTLTPGTSTFSLTGTNPAINANGTTLYAMDVTIGTFGSEANFETDITLTNLTLATSKTAPIRVSYFIDSGVTITVTGTLTATTSDVRIRQLIQHTTPAHGASPAIVAAAVSLSNIDFGGINSSGAAAPFTGTSIGNWGYGPTGVTFTAPKTVYWRGITGTSEADDANVFGTSSGAAGANANYPLPQDTVIVDDNTLATTLEIGNALDFNINTLDARTRTAAINFDWEFGTLRFGGGNGGLYYSSAVTHPTSRSTFVRVQSSGVFELDTLEKRIPYNFIISQRNDGSSPTPKVKLLSNFLTGYSTVLTGVFYLRHGELDLNGYNATCSVLNINDLAIDTTSQQSRLTFNGGRMIAAFTGTNGTYVNASAAHNFVMEDGGYIELTGGTGTGTMTVDGTVSVDSYTLNGPNGMLSVKAKANIASYTTASTYFNNLDFSENVGTGSAAISARSYYGDVILKAGMTVSASTSAISFLGGETSNYNTAGLTVDTPLTIAKTGSGKVLLQGNANHTAAKTLLTTSGELDLNGYTLEAGTLDLDSTTDHTIRFNGGILSSGGSVVDCNPSANLFFADPENGTLRLTSAAAGVSFTMGSSSSKLPTIDIATSQTVTFGTVSNQSIVNLKNTVSPATLLFSANVTYTLDDFELTGTAGNLVTIDSTTGFSYTLSKSSGVVSADYLSIELSTATGGASWYAGANSIDVAGNTGWIFTAAPTILTGNNVTQTNQSTTGAIVVLGLVDLTGNNVTQTNQSTTGAITQVQTLTGNNVTQNNTSTTGAISQAHVLTGANVTQNNLSNTGAISQIHILTGANVTQNNTSGTGAITIGPILVGNNVTQTNLSSTGAIEVIIKEDAPAGAGYSPLTLTGSQWSRPQQSAYRRPAASIRKRT